MEILRIKNVTYSYIGSREKILSSVSRSFELGKFYAITGKSGAGKSTIARRCCHFLPDWTDRTAARSCSGVKISRERDIAIIEKTIFHWYFRTIISLTISHLWKI